MGAGGRIEEKLTMGVMFRGNPSLGNELASL